MKIFFLIFGGLLIGIFNNLMLKFTIKKFIQSKNIVIIHLSFLLRMIFIFLLFFIFLNKDWKNAIYMLAGLTIAKLCFIIITKIKINNENNT